MIEMHVILVLMIAAAVVAMEIEDLLSSVIALGAVGIGLSLEFLLLGAPDLAITQLVVEIIALVILIRATAGAAKFRERFHPGYAFCAFIFVVVFVAVSFQALRQLPAFGSPLMKIGAQYVAEAMRRTAAVNMVSAIILDFRGYDTLGEATILFASVIGVLAVMRKKGKSV